MTKKILFVCTGNICRSPTAEGVFRARAIEAGLDNWVIDSAGTHSYHVGEAPDPRSINHAKKRGYDLSAIRARKVTRADFTEFDYIFALDGGHLEHLQRMCPASSKAKLSLMLENADVPDPYYGHAKDFEHVLDLVEQASDAIIKRLSS